MTLFPVELGASETPGLLKNNLDLYVPFIQLMDKFLRSISYTKVHVFISHQHRFRDHSVHACLSVCLFALLSVC